MVLQNKGQGTPREVFSAESSTDLSGDVGRAAKLNAGKWELAGANPTGLIGIIVHGFPDDPFLTDVEVGAALVNAVDGEGLDAGDEVTSDAAGELTATLAVGDSLLGRVTAVSLNTEDCTLLLYGASPRKNA